MKFLRINAIFKIILSICNILIPLFVGPYIIRMLSRESFDIYNKASVELQLFLTLAFLGIYTYGIREVSRIRKNKESAKQTFSELFLLGLIFNLVFVFLYYIYITLINNHTDQMIYFILMIQFIGSAVFVEWMNEALEDYRFITIKSMVVKFLYIVSIFIFIKSDQLIRYGLIVSITYIVDNLLSFLYITKRSGLTIKNLNFKRHLKPLLLVFLITNISLLYAQSDKIMLGLMISETAVTTYNLPNYIVTSIYNVIISIFVVSIARLNDLLNNKSEKDYATLFNLISRTFYLLFIPVMFYVFSVSKEIIVLYGAGYYNDCIIPLRVFSIVIIINSFVYIQREGVVYLYEKEKQIILFNLIGGLFNFLSNIILYYTGLFTPTLSIITLFFAYLIVFFLLKRYIKRQINPNLEIISKRIGLYFIFSLPVFLIYYLVRIVFISNVMRLVMTLFIFGFVYLVLLLLFKDDIARRNYQGFIKRVINLKAKYKLK